MMQYSLLDRRPEEAALSLLRQHDIGVLARGSVASGLLVNKEAKAYLNYSEEEVAAAAHAISEVSGDRRSNAQTALQFVLSHPAITSAVVGIRTIEQLEEAAKKPDVIKLSESEVSRLRSAIAVNKYSDHR